MSLEERERLKDIFEAALRHEPAARKKFVARECDGDETLQMEIESLLASFDQAGSFLEGAAVDEVADAVFEDLSGKTFGHYEIIEQIGTGGMGEVYLAKDTKLERRVAVKVLSQKFNRHQVNIRRFIKEAQAASALNHPNILVIHEIGETDGRNFIVSEYIEGQTLRELLVRSPVTPAQVVDIVIQVTNALLAAHNANIVHRDIKPENIMIRPDGLIKILDFGLAKLVEEKNKSLIRLDKSTLKQNQTAKGIILGTVSYMSPEQAKGEKIDGRTDIFSLGVVVYEMLAGYTPFAGDSTPETFANILNKEPLPLKNTPEALQRIVLKTLKKNKDERYQTIQDLRTDLKVLQKRLDLESELESSRSSDPNREATNSLEPGTGVGASGNLTLSTAAEDELKLSKAVFPGSARESDVTKELHQKKSKQLVAGSTRNLKSRLIVASTFMLLAAAILGYYFLVPRESSSTTKKSLAVLPFVNASRDPNAEYLSDGIADGVINRLSQLGGLRVLSRNSAFRFRENQTDTKNIASQLNVENIVTGDIKQIGDKFVINVRLIDAKEDSTVWGNQYVKTSADVLVAQNEIAQAVANNLRLRLTRTEQQQLEKRQTDDPKAYEFYLRGRFHFFKTTEPDFLKAIDYFQQAIQLDSNYALAYTGMGEAYRSLPIAGYSASKEAFPQAKAAAEKALEISPDSAEAHIVLGWVAFNYEWDWALAEKELKQAIELSPDNSDAHRAYGHLFSTLGKHEQAMAEIRLARELAPLTLINLALEGQFLFYGERHEEAIAAFQKALEIDPNYWIAYNGLGRVYIKQGRYAEAIAALEKARQLSPETAETITQIGYAQAKSGDREKALQLIEELKSLSVKRFIPNYAYAMIYNGLGQREEALKYLEKSLQEREVQITFIKIDSRWDELRGDPRFQEIIERVGL